jgi:hypothetical protein
VQDMLRVAVHSYFGKPVLPSSEVPYQARVN